MSMYVGVSSLHVWLIWGYCARQLITIPFRDIWSSIRGEREGWGYGMFSLAKTEKKRKEKGRSERDGGLLMDVGRLLRGSKQKAVTDSLGLCRPSHNRIRRE